jgi:anaerobic selenocysteine-containing dehydrogenase
MTQPSLIPTICPYCGVGCGLSEPLTEIAILRCGHRAGIIGTGSDGDDFAIDHS